MAELASGAVKSLLGVIRNEGQLLSGVQGNVQFIKEEMESMNSFLLHLARTAPPGGEHDEQVRTWMNQVRILANDCNNCIDLYLYRGNPEIHLPKHALWRYLRWVPWFLQKTVAQHRAAIQLRELKERARDVGKRRLRYGVEVPGKVAAAAAASGQPSLLPSAGPAAAAMGDGNDDEDDGDDQVLMAAVKDHSGRRALLESSCTSTIDDYLEGMLVKWMNRKTRESVALPLSVAIVAPDSEGAYAIAHKARATAETRFKLQVISVDIGVHLGPTSRIQRIFWRLAGVTFLDIMFCILQELKQPAQATKDEKSRLVDEIRGKIKDEMKVVDKFDKISSCIEQTKEVVLEHMKAGQLEGRSSVEPLGIILLALQQLKRRPAAADGVDAANDQGKQREKDMDTLASYNIPKVARKLKKYMETVVEAKEHREREHQGGAKGPLPIVLQDTKYESIIREVFPTSKSQLQAAQDQGNLEATRATTVSGTLGEHQMKEIVHRVLQELQQQGKYVSMLAAGSSNDLGQDQIPDDTAVEESVNALLAEARNKIYKIQGKVFEELKTKGIMDKIQKFLNGKRTLIILKINERNINNWDFTRNALSMLGCVDGTVIVTTTRSNERAKNYCCPSSQDPIHYSPVGLYHETVLELTTQQKNEASNYSPKTLHDILAECDPHEFCMKIFAHALYVNPKRSNEEQQLSKLHSALQAVSPKSLGTLAPKMIKFSYSDLPKECKSCLLYLAIFPPGHKIRRSTLIGRWVVEGLVTTEDWSWSSSVRKAEQYFDMLINQWLVYPIDIGATGQVKSCMVGDLVHKFITKIAKKQHIVEARLSHHLARHFSIFNDIRLRASDKIENFLENLSKSFQFPLLKVLDLEGCHCFGGRNNRYLKDICCKVFLLKYLSLRRTDVTKLPSEINNLHELEVLDIRQTKLGVTATRNIHILKLKRLLADGHIDPSPSNIDNGASGKVGQFSSSVQVPEKIENMEGMEVLLGVKLRTSQDLKGIGRLWQLRKLGIVIKDKKTHLNSLLEAISDLHVCLQSLSITLEGTSPGGGLLENIGSSLRCSSKVPETLTIECRPKILERLSINGTTKVVQLLPMLATNQLTKVTLSNTSLSQNDLEVLSKLQMLTCVRFREKAYTDSNLTFKKDDFQSLKYFLIEGSNMTDITFKDGASRELEKIVLSLSIGIKLCGVDNLPNLTELELNNKNNSSNIKSSRKDDDNMNNSSINAIPTDTVTTAHTNDTTATATSSSTTAVPTAHTTDTTTTAATASSTPDTSTTATTTATAAANDTTANASPIETSTMATTAATAHTTDTNATATADTNAIAITPATTATTTSTADPIEINKMLLSLLDNARKITKVTLRGTMLKQGSLQMLAKKPNISCLVLLEKSYDESQLTFNKEDFPNLKLLIVKCSNITAISFNIGSCPKIKKLIWTFTKMSSLTGIHNTWRLKELEFNGEFVCNEVKEEIKKHKNTPQFTHYKRNSKDQVEEKIEV